MIMSSNCLEGRASDVQVVHLLAHRAVIALPETVVTGAAAAVELPRIRDLEVVEAPAAAVAFRRAPVTPMAPSRLQEFDSISQSHGLRLRR